MFIINWEVKLFLASLKKEKKKSDKKPKEETAGKGQAELATEF